LRARLRASVKKYFRRNRVADGPARFAIERFDLYVAGVCRVGFNDRVPPKSPVVRRFNIDGERCVADVLAVDLDFSTFGFRDDLDFEPLPLNVRVRCAPGTEQQNGGHQGGRNGGEEWVGAMHESCLIRNGSGSSRILSLNFAVVRTNGRFGVGTGKTRRKRVRILGHSLESG
jgi:hypothetical protein